MMEMELGDGWIFHKHCKVTNFHKSLQYFLDLMTFLFPDFVTNLSIFMYRFIFISPLNGLLDV